MNDTLPRHVVGLATCGLLPYIAAPLVLLLLPQHEGLLHDLRVELTNRGNVADDHYKPSINKVFVAGDMRRGQSLVVWAISEGREAAIEVDKFLTQGKSVLNSKSYSKLLV